MLIPPKKIPATFNFKSPSFILTQPKNGASVQNKDTLSSSSLILEQSKPLSYVPRNHLFQGFNANVNLFNPNKSDILHSTSLLQSPTTSLTASPKIAIVGLSADCLFSSLPFDAYRFVAYPLCDVDILAAVALPGADRFTASTLPNADRFAASLLCDVDRLAAPPFYDADHLADFSNLR